MCRGWPIPPDPNRPDLSCGEYFEASGGCRSPRAPPGALLAQSSDLPGHLSFLEGSACSCPSLCSAL